MDSKNNLKKKDPLLTKKYNDKDPTEFYDTIIDLDSLKGACETDKGFDVLFSDKGYQNYKNQKKKDATIIGVIGNANKGKSYILSKISHEELPRGYSVTTKGISVKYPKIEKKRIIILDSAGSETPLIKNSNMENIKLSNNQDIELVNELARDKIATDNFLQEFIYFHSNILLVIVGQLTNDDQKLINRIKLIYGNKKYIFIIHNLMFIETIESAKKIIKDTILKSITFNKLTKMRYFDENDDKKNQFYYQESINDKVTILHLIMAREGSEAGDYYNNSTIQFLRKKIKSFNQIKNFDIIESFKNYLSIASGKYMEKPLEIENINYDEEKKKFIIKSENKINFKKCYVDEIGISNFQGNIIEPPYDYKIFDNKIVIQIELIGKVSGFHAKTIHIGGDYVFRYTGKIKCQYEEKKEMKIYDNIKDGDFRLQINIPITFGIIKDVLPKYDINKRNGVINLIYYYSINNENDGMIEL